MEYVHKWFHYCFTIDEEMEKQTELIRTCLYEGLNLLLNELMQTDGVPNIFSTFSVSSICWLRFFHSLVRRHLVWCAQKVVLLVLNDCKCVQFRCSMAKQCVEWKERKPSSAICSCRYVQQSTTFGRNKNCILRIKKQRAQKGRRKNSGVYCCVIAACIILFLLELFISCLFGVSLLLLTLGAIDPCA